MPNPVDQYLASLRSAARGGDATERTYYPALKVLLESSAPGVEAVSEPKRRECGAPDFAVKRGNLVVGHIEAKDLGASLDEIERSEQLAERYLPALDNILLTNLIEFRWYVRGERRRVESLGSLQPDRRSIRATAPGARAVGELLTSFLATEPRGAENARDLATRLARLAHEIREVIAEGFRRGHISADITDLRNAVKQELVPDLDDAQFADLFSQTLAYGFFAAWVHHPENAPFQRATAAADIPKTNPFLRRIFETITGTQLDEEPFAGYVDDLIQLLGRTDRAAVLEDFARASGREDPVVHFYETFLKEYDPRIRELRGVYYTPEPVVSYMVRSVDHLLKTRFNLPNGLADTAQAAYEVEGENGERIAKTGPRVLILDPACGTGTFLYEIVNHIRESYVKDGKSGAWKGSEGYVRKHLLPRLFGFELLMAPYAMAHLKLGMQLAGHDLAPGGTGAPPVAEDRTDRVSVLPTVLPTDRVSDGRTGSQPVPGADRVSRDGGTGAPPVEGEGTDRVSVLPGDATPPLHSQFAYDFESDERLGVYLTNTLEEAVRRAGELFGIYRVITQEANAAAEIKAEKPIMVVIGNPPYSGHSANRSWERKGGKRVPTFIGKLLQDYYQVDGKPLGERNPKWLQDDYVKFIRFGQWRVEHSGGGILALITNHSYLDNPTFRGMRQRLMQAFTDIYLLDLHGNSRKREVCPDGSKDENVFDIQQGVAIAIFVKKPNRPTGGTGAPPVGEEGTDRVSVLPAVLPTDRVSDGRTGAPPVFGTDGVSRDGGTGAPPVFGTDGVSRDGGTSAPPVFGTDGVSRDGGTSAPPVGGEGTDRVSVLPRGSAGPELAVTRRHLPHWQLGGSTYFVTFRLKGAPMPGPGRTGALAVGREGTDRVSVLPVGVGEGVCDLTAEERAIVKGEILHWHNARWTVHALTAMPDHVHILATPLEQSPGHWHSLSSILQSVKYGSALKINKLRRRRGSLWQAESFDRIVRDEKEFGEKANYILSNAGKAGLTLDAWEYDGFWCEEMEEGTDRVSMDGGTGAPPVGEEGTDRVSGDGGTGAPPVGREETDRVSVLPVGVGEGGRVFHADLWGLRRAKEGFLAQESCATIEWRELHPRSPGYLFVPQDDDLEREYGRHRKLTYVMPLNGVGMTTARDRMVVDFERGPLVERARVFRDSRDSDDELCASLGIPKKKGWSVQRARQLLRSEQDLERFVTPLLYRPFDLRLIFYHDSLVWRTVRRVMRHMLAGPNVGLCVGRAGVVVGGDEWNVAWCSSHITDFNLFYRGGNCNFPLYLYPDEGESAVSRDQKIHEAQQALAKAGGDAAAQQRLAETIQRLFPEAEYPRWPNLDPLLLAELEERLGLRFTFPAAHTGRTDTLSVQDGAGAPPVPGADGASALPEAFGPEDVFNYIYAVLHSPSYRERYADLLKRDFPRVPFTSDRGLFAALAGKGRELVALHLLESEALAGVRSELVGEGDNRVERVRYDAENDRVYINKTQYFRDLPGEVWEFRVGGYQVCDKWLKDRKGRVLSYDDQVHYAKTTIALRETIRLMGEIDKISPVCWS